MVDHIVHFTVKFVGTEHKSILFANFFDTLQCNLYVCNVTLCKMMLKFWYKCGPFFVYMSFTHKRDAFHKLSLNLIFRTTHCQINQMLLNQLKTFNIDIGPWVVFVSRYRLCFAFTLIFVVGVVMLAICFFNDIFDKHSDELAILEGESLLRSNVL